MPIYEYRCAACGHQDEHLQKVADAPLTACPSCGKRKYQKQLSAAGFQLKGTGWYATDYAKKDSGAPAKTDGESKPDDSKEKTDAKGAGESSPSSAVTKSESKSDAKTEAKTATKSESKTVKKAD